MVRIRGGQDKLAQKPDCCNIPIETKYQDLKGGPPAGLGWDLRVQVREPPLSGSCM